MQLWMNLHNNHCHTFTYTSTVQLLAFIELLLNRTNYQLLPHLFLGVDDVFPEEILVDWLRRPSLVGVATGTLAPSPGGGRGRRVVTNVTADHKPRQVLVLSIHHKNVTKTEAHTKPHEERRAYSGVYFVKLCQYYT